MEEYRRNGQEGKTVFVGVDLHRFKMNSCTKEGRQTYDLRFN